MRKLVLKTKFSLGDVVMMTAAVRDLHRCYPNQYLTDVRTFFPEIWQNNPHITRLDERGPDVEVIECRYPLINFANERPYHCLHGYIDFLNRRLGLHVVPTEFKGDIHLAREEREWASQVRELSGEDIPFWIVAAGGKYDITIKWWSTERYQQVVDHFRGRIAFVQVGEMGHHHPKLAGAVDLRGQTTVRELVRLVYHAQGCLCGVTALMHLAAAVELKPGCSARRPCVVIAGAREPAHWEAYPSHQFLHSIGSVACQENAGCWRGRTVALGDRTAHDKPESLCQNVSGGLPRCMDLIRAEDVIGAIEKSFRGGALSYQTKAQSRAAVRAIAATGNNTYDSDSLSRCDAAEKLTAAIGRLPSYPRKYSGRGVVICGGGLKYFPCAWVCIQMLRRSGCGLPVELWYEGGEEMDGRMISLMESMDVQCVDARKLAEDYPRRTSGGWELKAYAILHSRFLEVMLLDADNVPVEDPSFLFDLAEYKKTGAIFWPDYGSLAPDRAIWDICAVPYRDEPEFETGQIVVDKRKCWRALNLAFWFNDHSDFFYQYIYGDKDTFHMAWRKLDQAYTMVPFPIKSLSGIMCQHDLNGKRLFQHRNTHKWKLFGRNRRVPGFRFEGQCLRYLKQLEDCWDGKIHPDFQGLVQMHGFVFRSGTSDEAVFRAVVEKNEYELPEKISAKDVIIDIGAHIGTYSYACLARGARRVEAYEPESENFRLASHNLREFSGRVRLHKLAVWRSDRHPEPLPYSGYVHAETHVNTGGGTVLTHWEQSPRHERKELVPSTSLDEILRRFKEVHLLKLDCEGSEWPILFTSRLLGRVRKLCGEFHEFREIPTIAWVAGYRRYTRKELAAFLEARYKTVRTDFNAASGLGHFWAETPYCG